MNRAVYWLANHICKYALLWPYASVKVIGAQNIPRSGPLILASNHLNDADPPMIGFYFPRPVTTLAKVELFKFPVLKQFLQLYGAIPVRRGEGDLGALRRAQEALESGLTVCIFPEGTRSGTQARLIEAQPGAGFIALRSGAPVLPLAITGSQRLSLPKMFLRPFPRQHVTLTFGEPFNLDRPGRISSEAARNATQQIMQRIAALLPPEYRGYYGSTPVAGVTNGTPGGAGE
jgi:1-acyl-sn-glycerol-3-phosphate acyltransferase